VRPDGAEADRRREVRAAARGWRRASAIDDATLAAIRASYPDDRGRLGPAFRSLAFVLTALALNAAFFFVIAVADPRGDAVGILALAFGIVLCALTEVQIGLLKRAEGGIEAASAFVGIAYVIGAAGWLMNEAHMPERTLVLAVLALAAALLAAAAARWGMPLCAALAAGAFFLLLARSPAGRLFWIAAAAAAAPLLVIFGDSPRLPPVHRRSCQAALAVALLAFYAAFNLWSWDHAFVESLGPGRAPALKDSSLRPLAMAGTVLIPAAALAFGIRSRRRLFLDLGVVLAVASLVTLRFYVHVAPLWLILTAGGSAAILGSLAIRRFLDSGAGRERRGFTAEPLFEDLSRQGALETAAALASAPSARRVPAEDRSFTSGGGRFGGGGATGEY